MTVAPEVLEVLRQLDFPTAAALVAYVDATAIPPSWEGDLGGTAIEVVPDNGGAIVTLTRVVNGGLMGVQLTDRALLAFATLGARVMLSAVRGLEPEVETTEETPAQPPPT